ncbi:folylpolyglutamate synthetase and dihydrofolate synthetase [Coprinopsis cinerea okayama7|uniref:Folylpolyglutamate synthetase and dihydrofolate synthetase n=1 Tax=Coprinopsis cinerea (strain Okayama-7 / 130 / ATCC MYA-4618 / FGSC 9003) TaxID=240176 RepID=A8PFT2_COPC7|nr:folylpolyglutamate synthetase and dihydrofolate synthetase [Coprinopsis cinerea okayama7\|eukprot:XP_001841006.2 folylpolyglutamate synthetase and dihydrofolate synthetase [Coprinopsis cinerea okayama7\
MSGPSSSDQAPSLHWSVVGCEGSHCFYRSNCFSVETPERLYSPTLPRLRVGRFNSPHLTKITDCITIDNEPVDDETYHGIRTRIETLSRDSGASLTPFEVLTLTALQIFESSRVDVAVIEVGMGGRLDATNIIPTEYILVSALTTVDLDHQQFLGSTIEDVAREKLGIARQGKPLVLGHQRHPSVELLAKEVLHSVGAMLERPVPVSELHFDANVAISLRTNAVKTIPSRHVEFTLPALGSGSMSAPFPLSGDHQLSNLSTALGIVDSLIRSAQFQISADAVTKGISHIQWKGRLSWHTLNLDTQGSLNHPILVDGAHNAGSSQALAKYINQTISTFQLNNVHLHYILALSHSPTKPPSETLSPILMNLPSAISAVNVATVEFTPPDQMPWVQPVPAQDVEEAVKVLAPLARVWSSGNGSIQGSVNTGLTSAFSWVASNIRDADLVATPPPNRPHHLVALAGSLYLVADFYRVLEGEGGLAGLL